MLYISYIVNYSLPTNSNRISKLYYTRNSLKRGRYLASFICTMLKRCLQCDDVLGSVCSKQISEVAEGVQCKRGQVRGSGGGVSCV